MAGRLDGELEEAPRRLLRFGEFVVDPGSRALWRGDEPVPLTPKVFSVLVALLERPGRVMAKDELIGKVWPDTFVSDANLTQSISTLRKALGERAQDRLYVVTVPGAGYSFVAEVEEAWTGEAPAAAPEEAAAAGEDAAPAAPAAPISRRKSRRRFAILSAALLIAVAVVAAVAWLVMTQADRKPNAQRLSIAALRFKNLSAKSEAQWLSNALPELLTTELAAVKEVRVIPAERMARVRLTSEATTLNPKDLRQIDEILGADLLVTGSYLTLGKGAEGKLRLDVWVLRLPSGEQVVSLAETGTEAKLFDLVSRTGARLRTALGVAGLTPQQARAARALTPASPEAARLYTDGLERLRAFDPAGARNLLQQARSEDPGSAVIRSALSKACADMGDDAGAVKAAREAVVLAGALPRAERLAIQARLHEVRKEWGKASDIYRSLWTFYPDDLEYGLRLAASLAEAGRGAESLKVIAELRRLPSPFGTDPRIDLAEATAARRLANLETQWRAATAAAAKGSRSKEDLVVAQALLLQGEVLVRRGWPGAVARLQQASRGFERAGDQNGVVKALTLVGVALRERGDLNGAERHFQEALAIAQRLGSLSGLALLRANLGVIYQQRGELSRAYETLEEARALFARLGDRVLEARTLEALAMTRLALGSPAAARNDLEDALETSRATGNRRDEGKALQHLGTILALEGRLEEARRRQEQAVWILQKAGDFSLAAGAYADSAETLIRQGHLAVAKKRLDRALAVKLRTGDRIGAAEVLDLQAGLAHAAGDLGAAVSLNERMLADARQLPNRPLEAKGLLRQGMLRRAAGRLDEAQQSLDAALRLCVEMGDELQAESVRRELAALADARSGKT